MLVALRFAYLGTFAAYHDEGPGTVEGELKLALSKLGTPALEWRTGSRTDRGVAALENVAVMKLERPNLNGIVADLNRVLPTGIWVLGAAVVDSEFNPRHAERRTYQYRIKQSGENLELMRDACQLFLGEHDMRGYARLEENRNPQRRIDEFEVREDGMDWVFLVRSPGFLWNQVRRMVGSVLAVGLGKFGLDQIAHTLATGERHARMEVAPPDGLMLLSLEYESPPDWDWNAGDHHHRVLHQARIQAATQAELLTKLAQIPPKKGQSRPNRS